MNLRPAVKKGRRVYVGTVTENHAFIKERYHLQDGPDYEHGFSPDGHRFIGRKEAVEFLKRYEPGIFIKLKGKIPPEGLHSHLYAMAKGIVQKLTEKEKTEGMPVQLGEKREAPAEVQAVDISKKHIIIFDRAGLYTYWARRVGRDVGQCDYFLPDCSAYPESPRAQIGKGYEEIRRINDVEFWQNLKKCDGVWFPDVYDGAFQNFIRTELGIPVYGSGLAEELEHFKMIFLDALKECGLYVPDTYHCKGIDEELLPYLEKARDTKWIKPRFRGDFETRKYSNMDRFRSWLDQEVRPKLVSNACNLECLVQSAIDSDCEIGYDGDYVNGEFCEDHLQGVEDKDSYFVSIFKRKIAQRSKDLLYKFKPALDKYGIYNGGLSTEVRETENESAFIDLTARIGSPPGELQCEQIKDYPKRVYLVSQGIMPKSDANGLYGAEIILTSPFYERNRELHVEYPKEFEQNIKLKCCYRQNGKNKIVQTGNGGFFGAVVTYGPDWQKCCEEAAEIAESIKAEEYDYKPNPAAFENITKSMEAAEKYGYDFTSEDK